MFTTPEGVRERTGYEVTHDLVRKAQAVIEAYTGRIEADITNPSDQFALGRATEFQAAYMNKNYETVYEQVGVAQITGGDGTVTYKSGDDTSPWIAPLAVLACKNLSWKRSRSVKTFPTFQDNAVNRDHWRTV